MSKSKLMPRRKPVSEINVVPYLDVMLVLLVVFMITAPMLVQGVKVELPDANAKPIELSQKDEMVIVSIDDKGTFYLNVGGDPKRPKSKEQVTDIISKIVKEKPKTTVLIEGDSRVPYGVVVTIMASLQQAGVPNVGLITESPVSER
ncbi:protein TolR [Gammaproteobacteria bacterium 42_54_T18]|nr:protein TolR [Gammaproteobacteria bacterium 42_54_T18]